MNGHPNCAGISTLTELHASWHFTSTFRCGQENSKKCLLQQDRIVHVLGVWVLLDKICTPVDNGIRIQAHAPTHHVRHGFFPVITAVVPDIAHRAHRTDRPMVVKVRRLRGQADALFAALDALAEESHQDIIRVRHGLERDLLHDAPRAAVAQRVPKRADALLRVADRARVRRVLFLERKRLVDGPQVLLRRDRLVVAVDDARLGDIRRLGKGEVQAAVADPEQVPVVAVRRVAGRHGVGESIERNFVAFGGRGVEKRGISVRGGRRRGPCEGLDEGARRQCKVAKLLVDANIPIGIVFEDQHRGEVLSNDSVFLLVPITAARCDCAE